MPEIPVAIIQQPSVFLNLRASIVKAEQLIRDASADGARIVVFPETWLPGYPVWLDTAAGSALWGHKPAEAMFRILVANCPSIDGPE
ncbi:MAG: carbon-nitrogen hydrolase family protein, partial [Cupriavidus sp.]